MTDLTPHEQDRLRRVLGALADTAPEAPALDSARRSAPRLRWAVAAFAVTVTVLGAAVLLSRGDGGEVATTTTSATTVPETTTTDSSTTTTTSTTSTTRPAPTTLPPTLPRVGEEVDLDVDPFNAANAIYYDFFNGLWLAAGGGESDPDEVPEVYGIDPRTRRVAESIEIGLGGSIFQMDGNDEALWMLHPGDGAAPDTLIARRDTLNQVTTVTNLGMEYRIGAIAAATGGLWTLGGPPDQAAFFATSGSTFTTTHTLPDGVDFTDLVVATGAIWNDAPNLWVSSPSGSVYEIDVATGDVLAVAAVNGTPIQIGTSSRDIWVLGVDGTLTALDRDGNIVVEWAPPQPEGRACCLLVSPTSDSVDFFYESSEGYQATRDLPPELVWDAGQDFVVGAAQAGLGIWTAGETITLIALGQ